MADRLDEGTVHGRSELPPFVAARVFQPGVLDQPHVESPPIEPALSLYGELDCIRHRLPSRLIAAAERRAAESGVGADRVLIACGAISEEDYLRAFSTWHGLAFEPLEEVPREACPLTDDRLIDAGAAGLLPLRSPNGIVWVVAPRNIAARRLRDFVDPRPDLARHMRITTAERLNRFVAQHAAYALGARATDALARAQPQMSAAPRKWCPPIAAVLALAALALAALVWAPNFTIAMVDVVLAIIFIAWIALRMFGTLVRRAAPAPVANRADIELPIYTVIAALYREAAAVDGLLKARGDSPSQAAFDLASGPQAARNPSPQVEHNQVLDRDAGVCRCLSLGFLGNQVPTGPRRAGNLIGPRPRLFQAPVVHAAQRDAADLARTPDAVGKVPGLNAAGRDPDRQPDAALIWHPVGDLRGPQSVDCPLGE